MPLASLTYEQSTRSNPNPVTTGSASSNASCAIFDLLANVISPSTTKNGHAIRLPVQKKLFYELANSIIFKRIVQTENCPYFFTLLYSFRGSNTVK
jgi:hypothetical protein